MPIQTNTGATPADPIEYLGRSYSAEEFERAFNPRVYTPDAETKAASRAGLSADMRARFEGVLGIPYGTRPRETIDIFPSARPNAPVLIFIHGGFWRTGSARDNSFFAEPFVAAGACCALVNYDLCPAVGIGHIVEQIPRAIAWIHSEISQHGGDPNRLYLVGHSAGAHLIAMAMSQRDALPNEAIQGVTLISGVYDLAPMLDTSVNADLGLSPDDIGPLSPLLHPPSARLPLVVAVGEDESPEWIEQSDRYAAAAETQGCPVDRIDVPATDHYSIVIDIGQPDNRLAKAILAGIGI